MPEFLQNRVEDGGDGSRLLQDPEDPADQEDEENDVGGLDQASGNQVLELLDALNHDHDRTLVLVTHDESIAARATRVIRMTDGKIVADTDR